MGLLGSDGGESQSTQTSTGEQQSKSSSNQGSQSSGSSSSSSASGISDWAEQFLQKTSANANYGDRGYSKQSALTDVQGVLRQQATDALQQVMPSIAKQQISSGMYDTTTKQLMQNDANARITSQLASTQLDAIKNYASIDNQYAQTESDKLKAAAALAGATNSSTAQSSSSQQSSSFGTSNSESYGTQSSSGKTDSDGGGSGLLGLFADGGQVPEPGSQGNMALDILDRLTKLGQSFNLTQPDQVEKSTTEKTDVNSISADADKSFLSAVAADAKSSKMGSSMAGQYIDNFITTSAMSLLGFANGGEVPKDASAQLLAAIQKHANGGQVRTGESDVQAGGKIRGPQTKDGEDNQVIAVGGGEGIIAADVMKIPGIAELVDHLNTNYHKPTR